MLGSVISVYSSPSLPRRAGDSERDNICACCKPARERVPELMKRQVGGTANKIMLWPLGGVAYVDPPPRPAATLWSIAAGPLVNVVLLGASPTLAFWGRHVAWRLTFPHAYKLLWAILAMNLGLLVFNLLPIYRVQRMAIPFR